LDGLQQNPVREADVFLTVDGQRAHYFHPPFSYSL
jgi:hypothetical protein